MTERKMIEDRLRKKEQEIVSLEDKIKAARVYVQALRDILKMLASDDSEADAEAILRPGSAVADARQVILKRRAPVHINELLEALGKDVTRDAKSSLTSSIAAYVRRGEIFIRTAPNTFGLAELGHTSVDDDRSVEPPVDFGRDASPPSRSTASTSSRSLMDDDDEEIPF